MARVYVKHKHILLLIQISYPVVSDARAPATLLPAARSTASPLDRRAALPDSEEALVQINTNISIDRLCKRDGGGPGGCRTVCLCKPFSDSPVPPIPWFPLLKGRLLAVSHWRLLWFFDPVDLSTVVVAPTTCSLLLVITICMVKGFIPKIGGRVKGFIPKTGVFSEGFYSWKTPRNRTTLWK